jgi:hypothetical protein
MCYFRSTDIEQKNWKRLLWTFPDEMLYFMSQGEEITIIDKSNSRHGKIERIFCPVMDDFLNILYFDRNPINNHLKSHLEIALLELDDSSLERRFMFWKKYISFAKIRGETIQVEKEPNGNPNLIPLI